MKLFNKNFDKIAGLESIDARPSADANLSATQPDKVQELELNGPLSVIYTKALDIVYSKADPVTGALATESQANDEIMQQAMAQRVSEYVGSNSQNVRVYTMDGAVQKSETGIELTAPKVVEDAMSYIDPSNPIDFIFVEKAIKPTVDSPDGGTESTIIPMPAEQRVAVESITVIIKTKLV